MQFVVEFIEKNPVVSLIALLAVLVCLVIVLALLVNKLTSSRRFSAAVDEILTTIVKEVKKRVVKYRVNGDKPEQKAQVFDKMEPQYELTEDKPYDLKRLPEDLDVDEFVQSFADMALEAMLKKFSTDLNAYGELSAADGQIAAADNGVQYVNDDSLHQASVAVNELSAYKQSGRASLEEEKKKNAELIAKLQAEITALKAKKEEKKEEK